jgi:exportin-5
MCDFILGTPAVLEPILMFCNSTIRVRDTRSVVTIVRVLRSLLPRFREPSPIRDYFCNDILKSAITSLHEPYFVDCQKELASLIAGIIHLDEDTPRSIILSLPGMADESTAWTADCLSCVAPIARMSVCSVALSLTC